MRPGRTSFQKLIDEWNEQMAQVRKFVEEYARRRKVVFYAPVMEHIGLRVLSEKFVKSDKAFLSMRRIEARRRKASAFRVRFSKSLARRRQRLSQAKVRSTTHRRGKTAKPFA